MYGRSLCNHRRAYKFFTDSVSPSCAFPAVPCESYEKFLEGECFPCRDKSKCGNMGYHSDKSPARGKMYLLTRDEEPFCGKYLIPNRFRKHLTSTFRPYRKLKKIDFCIVYVSGLGTVIGIVVKTKL